MSPLLVSDMWGAVPGTDRSTKDWHVAQWLGFEGVSYDDALRVMTENSEKAAGRRNPQEYVERTLRRAWGLVKNGLD